MHTNFSHCFIVRTRNLCRVKVGLRQPPHLYFVAVLPSKTHTTANINVFLNTMQMYQLQLNGGCAMLFLRQCVDAVLCVHGGFVTFHAP